MFAVIFEVEPKAERGGEYLELAAFLKPELERIEGFMAVERFASLRTAGRVLSLSLWRDEKAVIRWRTQSAHHEVQAKGRSRIFQDYHLRVGEVTADSAQTAGAVPDQRRFDETETGAAKFVTITEFMGAAEPAAAGDARSAAGLPEAGAQGLIDWDAFSSIYQPGKLAVLGSWRDATAAGHWQPNIASGPETRHRRVRIIRDYGMFDRREAPQFYPPVNRS